MYKFNSIKLYKDISIIISLIFFIYLWDLQNIYNLPDLRVFIFFALPFYFQKFLKPNKFAFFVFSFLIIHLLSISYLNGYPITNKSIIQIFFIIYIIVFAFSLKDEIFEILPWIVRIFILIFTFLTIFEIQYISFKPNFDPSSSCSFFLDTSLTSKWLIFSENSHFGMVATGTFVYFIFLITKNKIRSDLFIFYPCIIFLNLVYSSTTYVLGIIISSFVIMIFLFQKKYILNFIVLFITIIFNSIIFFSMDECSSRISRANFSEYYQLSKLVDKKDIPHKKNISDEELLKLFKNANENDLELLIKNYNLILNLDKDSIDDIKNKKISEISKRINEKEKIYKNTNITVEVYENAFFVTLNAFKNKFYGYGINNYELAFNKFTLINFINSNKLEKGSRNNISPEILTLNKTDGRSNFFKLTTEFGVFSLIIYLFFIFFTLNNKIGLKEKSFLIPIIITQLISGAGYFNGGFILCVAIMIALSFPNKKINYD